MNDKSMAYRLKMSRSDTQNERMVGILWKMSLAGGGAYLPANTRVRARRNSWNIPSQRHLVPKVRFNGRTTILWKTGSKMNLGLMAKERWEGKWGDKIKGSLRRHLKLPTNWRNRDSSQKYKTRNWTFINITINQKRQNEQCSCDYTAPRHSARQARTWKEKRGRWMENIKKNQMEGPKTKKTERWRS